MTALKGTGIPASVGTLMFTFVGKKVCISHINMLFYQPVFALANEEHVHCYAYKLLE